MEADEAVEGGGGIDGDYNDFDGAEEGEMDDDAAGDGGGDGGGARDAKRRTVKIDTLKSNPESAASPPILATTAAPADVQESFALRITNLLLLQAPTPTWSLLLFVAQTMQKIICGVVENVAAFGATCPIYAMHMNPGAARDFCLQFGRMRQGSSDVASNAAPEFLVLMVDDIIRFCFNLSTATTSEQIRLSILEVFNSLNLFAALNSFVSFVLFSSILNSFLL